MVTKSNRKLYIILIIASLTLASCNLLMVAIRNVPVFFETPEKVNCTILNPIKPNIRLSALWIGHSTVLLQIEDKVIITDPILTETVGEFGRRVIEPGIETKNIPRCDIILISHSHFDHLSYASLDILEKKSAGSSLVFPKGLEYFLPCFKFNLVKMDNDKGFQNKIVGEQKKISGVTISSVIAHHWGGRYGIDGYIMGSTAFTGYILEYKGITVYFSGDTGYDTSSFKQLGKMFNIDLAILPIGPCAQCEQYGTPNHVFPPDAVMIFKDVNAKWLLPVHYGTFYFAQGDPMLPLSTLDNIILTDSLQNKIYPLKIGEQKIFY